MSDDKKRDRDLQRRVRERMAKTGESYQAAWRQLTDSDPPASDDEEKEQPSATRVILPFRSSTAAGEQSRILPNQPTRIAARSTSPTGATGGPIEVERIIITNAGTPGGAADWVLNDIEINGRSQLKRKDLPGALFGTDGIADRGGEHKLTFHGLDIVERGHEMTLIVTYTGPLLEGAFFHGGAMGQLPAQRPTIVPIATKKPVPPNTKTTIVIHAKNADFDVDRFVVDDSDTTGGAADWIIHDLRINGGSTFKKPGEIPAAVFAMSLGATFFKFEPCKADAAIEIDVRYIGLNEQGSVFSASLEGTVLRDDYTSAPPDLLVNVETKGQGAGELAVAKCNWRAPASDNRTR